MLVIHLIITYNAQLLLSFMSQNYVKRCIHLPNKQLLYLLARHIMKWQLNKVHQIKCKVARKFIILWSSIWDLPSLKILSWARAAILCLRTLLSTFRTKRWWSRKATLGDNTETSALTILTKQTRTRRRSHVRIKLPAAVVKQKKEFHLLICNKFNKPIMYLKGSYTSF